MANFSDFDVNDIECKMQIINLYRKLTDSLKKGRAELLTAETVEKAAFSEEDLETFGFKDSLEHQNSNSARITSFKMVGMKDPFPLTSQSLN